MGIFCEEKGFILRDIEKVKVSWQPVFEPLIYGLWVEISITELLDLLMSGHKIKVI